MHEDEREAHRKARESQNSRCQATRENALEVLTVGGKGRRMCTLIILFFYNDVFMHLVNKNDTISSCDY
jgi:hypothetical protein